MKKNGFTFVELLAVITILGVIALLTIPTVEKLVKKNKEELHQTQLNNIIVSLKNWSSDNREYLPEENNEILTLNLGILKSEGYIDYNIKSPKNNKCFDNSMVLQIKKVNTKFEYLIDNNTIKYSDNCEVETNLPTILLNGNIIDFVDLNSIYNDLGVIAKDVNGNDITSKVTKTITGSGNSIDTSILNNQYIITYSVTINDKTASTSRTVKIVDRKVPELVIPGNITINTNVNNLDLMEGVSATDNSGETIQVTTSSDISFGIPGTYNVTYTAEDSSGNIINKNRLVIIQMGPYIDVVLNGADPVVKTGMIPVNIAPDGIVTKADIYSEWYDYANKEWANVVTVTEESRANYMNAPAGTQIQETDILTYLVWIPRYKYELWNVDVTTPSKATPHSIAITFENKDTAKSNGSTNGTYLTHPAFTFGTEELNGIWVGKFETGHKTASNPNSVDTANVVIKPNVTSWRSITVSNAFNTVKGMNGANNAFGLDTTSDTHMMKNTEWGAVAYLSHSAYGKDGEVYINNASTFTTGCGANNASDSQNSSCLNAYGSKSDNVYNQSTTGNISGVFDMSGGAYEYVMGYNGNYGDSGFAANYVIEDKYVDRYDAPSSNTDYVKRILGDATGEMGPFSSNRGSWYQDYAYFINGNSSWFLRGGNYSDISYAGVFYFYHSNGYYYNSRSFRVTIA